MMLTFMRKNELSKRGREMNVRNVLPNLFTLQCSGKFELTIWFRTNDRSYGSYCDSEHYQHCGNSKFVS